MNNLWLSLIVFLFYTNVYSQSLDTVKSHKALIDSGKTKYLIVSDTAKHIGVLLGHEIILKGKVLDAAKNIPYASLKITEINLIKVADSSSNSG